MSPLHHGSPVVTAPARPLARSTVLVLEPQGQPVQAWWVYDPADPFAVVLRIRSRRERWVDWRFARDLLDEGLSAPAGLGDIRLEPFPGDGLLVTLDPPDGHVLFRADGDHARRFLRATYDLVAPDTECEHPGVEWALVNLDLDAWAGGGCDCGGAW